MIYTKEEIKNNFANTRAWDYTSFDPEKRMEHFTNEFFEDLENIKNLCVNYKVESEKFENKVYQLAIDYLYSKSRCISWAIVGPARFPVAKAEKRSNSADNKLNNYVNFVNNFEKLLKKITRKKETEEDKKSKWKKELEERKKLQELMKKFNKESKKDYERSFEELPEFLKEELFSLKKCFNLEKPYFVEFKLRNNLANIKRLEEQIQVIEKCQNKNLDDYIFAGGKVVYDAEEIRYNIFFDEIPSIEIRQKIKSNGFKWSPSRKAWTRGAKTISLDTIKTLL